MKEFKLWLEFEEGDSGSSSVDNAFANIEVTLTNGQKFGINVWTYTFLETAVKQDQSSGDNLKGLYQVPPDLFVKEMTRDCIEKSISDLLNEGELDILLNPSVIANEIE